MILLFLIFLRNSIIFSTTAVPSYIPTNKQCTRVLVFHIITDTFYVLFFIFLFFIFDSSHPSEHTSLVVQRLRLCAPNEGTPGSIPGQGIRSHILQGFSGGSLVKNPPPNARGAGDTGSTPGSGRSPGGGNGNPLQSWLGNPMDIGAWRDTVLRVSEIWMQLNN